MNRPDLVATGQQLLRQAYTILKLYPDRSLMAAAVVSDVPDPAPTGHRSADALRSAMARLRGAMLGLRDGGVRNPDPLRAALSDVERLCAVVRNCVEDDPHCTCLRCRR